MIRPVMAENRFSARGSFGVARAALALEDVTVYFGESFGASGTVSGEVCFNTSMTGYQEILTDPS